MAKYVSRGAQKPRKSKVLIFLNIVIGFLAAFVIFGLIGFITSSRDSYYDRMFGNSSVSRDIESGDYTDLLNDYQREYGVIGMVNPGYGEAAAVAEYADAAMRYSAYQEAGDSERAAKQKARMDDAAGRVGIYEPELSRIDDILSGGTGF